MTAERPLCLQIAALGGQGGGVLTDWLTEAARHAGYPAQATSIPGVAQRTGATTYYFELYPEKDPPAPPLFSLFPDTDDLALMAALEPTEAGRALERGLITGRTTVITARDRIYSTDEKMKAGDGRVPAGRMMDALQASAAGLIALDVEDLARRSGGQGNAVLFGAIIGAGVLPLGPDDARDAIAAGGKAVDSNLAGFEAGLEAAKRGGDGPARDPDLVYDPVPDALAGELDGVPEALRPIVGHGLARLLDYQDAAYARHYRARLAPFLAADEGLAREVARRLAAWMAAEDVIRVAQLKTKPGRLARIRGELGIGPDEPLRVYDYLKPGAEEVAHVLPDPLAKAILATGLGRKGIGLRLPSAHPVGFGLLKLMAALRPLRRRSHGFGKEQAAIEQWLAAVTAAAAVDPALARDTAELAVWARGYGPVRQRGLDRLAGLFAHWDDRLKNNRDGLAGAVRKAITDAREDPDGDCRSG
ncbi:MAG: indolepyruvate oxidoreductase subunit beta family protein [Rhodobacterales bacterium]|nr:indolepyruvate oxidoreductase subunit beta family protein [Rhodobacterales bacterium]